ncbi:MAG: hypothetical protein ACI33I_08755, partial [Clostridium sp.]
MTNIGSVLGLNITIIALGIFSYYINNLSNNGIYFGIRIPKKFQGIKEIKDLEKEYKRMVIVSFLIFIVLFNLVCFINKNSSEEILSLILVFASIVSIIIHGTMYFIYNIKLKKLKEKNNWNYKSNNIVVVDTTLRKPKKDEKYKPLSEWIFLIPIILPIILLILTYIKRDTLINLEEFEIYRIPFIGVIMCLFIYFLAKISLKSKVDLNSSNIESTIKNKKKIKRLISLFFLVSEIEIIILYSIMQFAIIYSFYSDKLLLYVNIIISLSMIIFILAFIIIGIKERSIKESEEEV